jgi:hypothetical protein
MPKLDAHINHAFFTLSRRTRAGELRKLHPGFEKPGFLTEVFRLASHAERPGRNERMTKFAGEENGKSGTHSPERTERQFRKPALH